MEAHFTFDIRRLTGFPSALNRVQKQMQFVTAKGNEDAGGPSPGEKHLGHQGYVSLLHKKSRPAWASSQHPKAAAWKHKVPCKPYQKVMNESKHVGRKLLLLGFDILTSSGKAKNAPSLENSPASLLQQREG